MEKDAVKAMMFKNLTLSPIRSSLSNYPPHVRQYMIVNNIQARFRDVQITDSYIRIFTRDLYRGSSLLVKYTWDDKLETMREFTKITRGKKSWKSYRIHTHKCWMYVEQPFYFFSTNQIKWVDLLKVRPKTCEEFMRMYLPNWKGEVPAWKGENILSIAETYGVKFKNLQEYEAFNKTTPVLEGFAEDVLRRYQVSSHHILLIEDSCNYSNWPTGRRVDSDF